MAVPCLACRTAKDECKMIDKSIERIFRISMKIEKLFIGSEVGLLQHFPDKFFWRFIFRCCTRRLIPLGKNVAGDDYTQFINPMVFLPISSCVWNVISIQILFYNLERSFCRHYRRTCPYGSGAVPYGTFLTVLQLSHFKIHFPRSV